MLRVPWLTGCLAVFVLLLWPAFSQAEGAQETAAQTATTAQAYPDSTDGLEKLVLDIVAAEKSGNELALAAYRQSLALPDAENWFKTALGPETGSIIGERYAKREISSVKFILAPFSEITSADLSHVEVRRFEQICDSRVSQSELEDLAEFKRLDRIYVVRPTNHHTKRGIFSLFFTYIDGAFRYLGTWRFTDPKGSDELPSLSGEGHVTPAKLVHPVRPVYPPDAKHKGLEGTIRLKGIISTDGSVHILQVVCGSGPLAESAVQAVRQWRYEPTLLNGKPVDVKTIIDVTFSLRQ